VIAPGFPLPNRESSRPVFKTWLVVYSEKDRSRNRITRAINPPAVSG
jgi:hypothetical protein